MLAAMRGPALVAAVATAVAVLVPSVPARAQPPGAPIDEGLGVRLNLVYPEPRVVLQQAPRATTRGPGVPAGDWTDVCRAPCQSDARANTVYRVAGSNMFPSPAFEVPLGAGLVHVDVEPASKLYYWTGLSIFAVGAATFLTGIVMFNRLGLSPTDEKRNLVFWSFCLGPSAMLGGAILWARNNSSELTVRY